MKTVRGELYGEFLYTLDAKGRVFIPAKFREELSEEFIIVRSVERCINIYSADMWSEFVERLRTLPQVQLRDVKRFIFPSATAVTADTQGRIVIPQKLREYASLEKNVTIIGMSDHGEIWDSAAYSEYSKALDNRKLMEILMDNGF